MEVEVVKTRQVLDPNLNSVDLANELFVSQFLPLLAGIMIVLT